MRTCSSCQARNTQHSTFCIRCGAALSDLNRDPAANTDALPVQPEQVPDTLVDQAAAQLGEGQAQAAVENCCRAIALNPRHVEAHVVLGMALEQRGELQPALEAYETVLALAPDRPVERQKAALLRLRLGHDRPAAPPRPRAQLSFANCWTWLRQAVTEKPAVSAGLGAGLLMFALLAIVLAANGRAQAREAVKAQYAQELQLARQATAEQRYTEAASHYAAAWKLQAGDEAVRAEWAQAYQWAGYYAQQYQREMEIAQLPKYLANTTGRNPFEPVPIRPTTAAAPTTAPDMSATLAVPPPTYNTGARNYDSVQAPVRVTPPPTTTPGFTHRRDVGGNSIITPVMPRATEKPTATPAANDTIAKAPKGEITIWTSKPPSKPAPQPETNGGRDAGSMRSKGEALGRQGRADEAIPELERAAGAYDDLARQDPNNAAAHKQAADSCRARIDLLRQGNR